MSEEKLTKLFWQILVPGVLIYLVAQFAFAHGVMTERQRKECLTPGVAQSWESVIDVAEGVYLNVASTYTKQIEEDQNLITYWRDQDYWAYNNLKSCEEAL